MSYQYPSLFDAARALLVEACTVLNKRQVEYVIAGGWVPMLRVESHNGLQHPGTRDVDVLFNDDRETIRNAVQLFLASGFVLSAKHEFQLLKTLNVGARQFVFNIDLMHPAEASLQPEMFRDIMDLGIGSDYDETKPKVKSICFPSSAIIFQQNLWSMVKVGAIDWNGEDSECNVPLMDESALILSKADSVKQDKRARDAFDIYFLLFGPQGQHIADQLKHLSASFPQVSLQLERLHRFLGEHPEKFDKNALSYCRENPRVAKPSEYVRTLLFS